MKVLFFGIYSKGIEYPRNNNLIKALKRLNIEVEETHLDLLANYQHRIKAAQNLAASIRFLLRLFVSWIVLAVKYFKSKHIAAIIVGHPGHFHIYLARFLSFLTPSQPLVILDVFFPLHDAVVVDRKLIQADGYASRLLKKFEALCCRSADICLLDTKTHCRYIREAFKLPRERVCHVYLGSTIQSNYSRPARPANTNFRVLYTGTYIPLHGVKTIVLAAQILRNNPEVRFTFIGRGQLKQEIKDLVEDLHLDNIEFLDWVATNRLGQTIRNHHLSLGIFGTTPKAFRVIPSKIYDICAAGVPFITADTPAIQEAFAHKKNAFIIPAGDPTALANAILTLKNDPGLMRNIASAALDIDKTLFSLDQIGRQLVDILNAASQRKISSKNQK
jgi:glycosyltransferase involved in cell wall biosynthesis